MSNYTQNLTVCQDHLGLDALLDTPDKSGLRGAGVRAHANACTPAHVHRSNYQLPQVWADYLNTFNPWSWYGHFTFRSYPHPETAIKTFDLWVHKLNRAIFGCRYYKRPLSGVSWARASELQRRGVIHFHAILGRIPEASNVKRLTWMDMWYTLGGICRIMRYESGKGAEYYMSKSTYAWKHGEIDLSGNLPQLPITW